MVHGLYTSVSIQVTLTSVAAGTAVKVDCCDDFQRTLSGPSLEHGVQFEHGDESAGVQVIAVTATRLVGLVEEVG